MLIFQSNIFLNNYCSLFTFVSPLFIHIAGKFIFFINFFCQRIIHSLEWVPGAKRTKLEDQILTQNHCTLLSIEKTAIQTLYLLPLKKPWHEILIKTTLRLLSAWQTRLPQDTNHRRNRQGMRLRNNNSFMLFKYLSIFIFTGIPQHCVILWLWNSAFTRFSYTWTITTIVHKK